MGRDKRRQGKKKTPPVFGIFYAKLHFQFSLFIISELIFISYLSMCGRCAYQLVLPPLSFRLLNSYELIWYEKQEKEKKVMYYMAAYYDDWIWWQRSFSPSLSQSVLFKSQQTYGEFNSFVINVVVNSVDHLPAIHRVIMDSIEELSLLLSMAARRRLVVPRLQSKQAHVRMYISTLSHNTTKEQYSANLSFSISHRTGSGDTFLVKCAGKFNLLQMQSLLVQSIQLHYCLRLLRWVDNAVLAPLRFY